MTVSISRQSATTRGVLVAVSIPIFTAQLRKARVATDLANERAAKAAAVAAALTDDDGAYGTNNDGSSVAKSELVYYYDAAAGTVKKQSDSVKDGSTGITAYGKVTDPNKANSNDNFADSAETTHVGKVVRVTVKSSVGTDSTNAVTITWVAA